MPVSFTAIMISIFVFASAILCLLAVQGATLIEGRSTPLANGDPKESLKALCPNLRRMSANEISTYRYDSHKLRCYRMETRGPCGNNMRFYAKDDVHGICDCNTSSTRILIFHAGTKQCYFILQKGYCKQGEWLDVTREGTPICTANPCAGQTTYSKEFVLFNGQCTELNKTHPDCQPNQKVEFEANSRLPKCLPKPLVTSQRPIISVMSIGVPASPCPVGSVNAIGGLCQPPFDFD